MTTLPETRQRGPGKQAPGADGRPAHCRVLCECRWDGETAPHTLTTGRETLNTTHHTTHHTNTTAREGRRRKRAATDFGQEGLGSVPRGGRGIVGVLFCCDVRIVAVYHTLLRFALRHIAAAAAHAG